MFQELRTLIYRVRPTDLKRATAWYSELLEQKPYFEQPFYVGFNVGGFELGLDPSDGQVAIGDNVQTYWGVADIEVAYQRCLKLGAQPDSPVRDVGERIQVATVKDPFGNILGLIHNPQFKTS